MLDWVAGSLELSGLWCVGNKWKIGFIANILGSACWIYVSLKTGIYGLLLVVIPAIFVNVRNFRKWAEEEAPKTSAPKNDNLMAGMILQTLDQNEKANSIK